MKSIIVAFEDFGPEFVPNKNFIIDGLNELCEVHVVDTYSIPENELNNQGIQFLIYSCFGSRHYYYRDCVKIFYTGECMVPDFNECDYAIGFDEITFGDRYFRYPLYASEYVEDLRKAKSRVLPSNPEKRKFCAMVVTNNHSANPIRGSFFEKLSEYQRVDSGGRFLNNIGRPEGVEDKQAFLKEYKFSMAFENTSYPGYCTEKIVQAYEAGNVPIYFGDPGATKYFNPKSFIYVDENHQEEAISRIKEINENDELYLSMLREPILLDEYYDDEAFHNRFISWLAEIISKEADEAGRVFRHGYGKHVVDENRKLKSVGAKYLGIDEYDDSSLIKKIKRKLLLILNY